MAHSFSLMILALMALFAVASAAAGCAYPVTKFNKVSYKLGSTAANELPGLPGSGLKCPSGYSGGKPDTTSMIQTSVLSQALIERIWPAMTGDFDIYTCPEGLKWLKFDQVSSCLGNKGAQVNGVIQFVCKNQARIRSMSVETDAVYKKVC